MTDKDEPKVKREPVNYLWTALNWDFLRLLAEIAQYAAGKYGSAEQYKNARLEGEKSPLNHAFEHLTQYMAGVKHDRFGTLDHQLAAAAYNIMMEYFDLKVRGFRGFILLAMQRAAEQTTPDSEGDGELNPLDDGALAEPRRPLGAVVDGKFVAAPLPETKTDWAEGLLHFRERWSDGFAGARDPGAVLRWKSMLWVLSQFDEVARTDEVILPLIEDIREAALAAMANLKTPENIMEQNAKIAALDTLKLKVPDMFPAKGVKVI